MGSESWSLNIQPQLMKTDPGRVESVNWSAKREALGHSSVALQSAKVKFNVTTPTNAFNLLLTAVINPKYTDPAEFAPATDQRSVLMFVLYSDQDTGFKKL